MFHIKFEVKNLPINSNIPNEWLIEQSTKHNITIPLYNKKREGIQSGITYDKPSRGNKKKLASRNLC